LLNNIGNNFNLHTAKILKSDGCNNAAFESDGFN